MREFELDEGVAIGFCKELGAQGHVCEVSFTTASAAVRAIGKVAAVLGVSVPHLVCVLASELIPAETAKSQTVGKDNPSAPAGHFPLHKGGVKRATTNKEGAYE